MPQADENTVTQSVSDNSVKAKKPYQEPWFRCERVFETMALACGKIDPTYRNCFFNRHSS